MRLLPFLLIFSSALAFAQHHENIYLVVKEGKKGYVDNHFNVVVKPLYDELGGLHNNFWGNYSLFKQDEKYGVLDTKGKIIIPAQYEYMEHIYHTTSPLFKITKDGKYGVIDHKGKEILPLLYDYTIESVHHGESFLVGKDEKYMLLDNKGNPKTKKMYEYINARYDTDFSVFQTGTTYGYLNDKGEEAISPQFTHASNFNDKYAIVQLNNAYGIIDKTGRFVVEPIYDNISYRYGFTSDQQFPTTSKVYYIKQQGKIGLLDEHLTTVLPPTYEEVGDFHEGFAFVANDKKYGYINTKGQLAIPLDYEEANSFSEGLAPVVKNEKWGYIDSLNKVVIAFQFTGVVEPFFEGLAAYRRRDFKTGKAYYVNDACGYIDMKGNIKIEPVYRTTYRFRNGVAVVEDDQFVYLINKANKRIVLQAAEQQIIDAE